MNETRWNVCVVDDDPSVREALEALLRSVGYRVESYGSAQAFLSRPGDVGPGCLILDVQLPDVTGLAVQSELRRRSADVPVIFITGHGDVSISVQAMKAGAVEFLTKPFDPQALLDAVATALAQRERGRQVGSQDGGAGRPCGILGRSSKLQGILREVSLVARTDATVLVHGETGSGKELVARAIHEQSGRTGPFVKVNCAALPPGLFESELLGHEKGSFTGAHARRIGRFELAQDGTLFLDEIGEMPLDVQPKILRLLQEREFERIGSNKTLHSNARLVAATNRDLRQMVSERLFREDLFYRLNVFDIAVPPLRERREDIPDLARHFLDRFAERCQKTFQPLADAALRHLCAYDWPGNIRELQNVMERAAILAVDGVLAFEDLGKTAREVTLPRGPAPEVGAGEREAQDDSAECSLAEANRRHILAALDATHWVIGGPHGAAARLGLKRSTLIFRMKKLGIRRGSTSEVIGTPLQGP